MKKFLKNIFLVGSVLLLMFCSKPPEYSNIPYIEPRDVTDSVVGIVDYTFVKIFFRDGDGNLGVDPNSAADQPIVKKCGYNYNLDIFVKQNGVFVPLVLPDTVFSYRKSYYPVLYKTTEKGPLEGELTFKGLDFTITDLTTPNLVGYDTVKFNVRIKDRECNISNQVETKEFVINRF